MSDKTSQEIFELYDRTNTDNPNPKDLEELRKIIAEQPSLFNLTKRLSLQSQMALLMKSGFTAAAQELVLLDIQQISTSLKYQESSMLEKMLIENIITCYLRYHIFEQTYNTKSSAGLSLSNAMDWERLLSLAQRRYFRAMETLVRIRRLGINIQVNIATDGGQQININQ